jgi:hypothetical protein
MRPKRTYVPCRTDTPSFVADSARLRVKLQHRTPRSSPFPERKQLRKVASISLAYIQPNSAILKCSSARSAYCED